MTITVGELKKLLEGVADDLPVSVYGPRDPSVGIWDLYGDVSGGCVYIDDEYADSEGNGYHTFQLLVTT